MVLLQRVSMQRRGQTGCISPRMRPGLLKRFLGARRTSDIYICAPAIAPSPARASCAFAPFTIAMDLVKCAATNEAQRHPTLWFDDGTLVLQVSTDCLTRRIVLDSRMSTRRPRRRSSMCTDRFSVARVNSSRTCAPSTRATSNRTALSIDRSSLRMSLGMPSRSCSACSIACKSTARLSSLTHSS